MGIPPVAGIVAGIFILIASSLALTVAIEGIGTRLRMSDSLTGAILSPMFTALPELIIVIEAIVVVGSGPGSEIAAGTIIGEPFMVSSIGIPAAVVVLLLSRKNDPEKLDPSLARVVILLGAVFPLMLIPHFFNSLAARILTSAILVIVYVLFMLLWKSEGEGSRRKISNRYLAILVAFGLLMLLAGSTVLVESINIFASQSGASRELISILIIPVGTIVPETMNSLIWASKLKTNLAVSALLGEELLFTTIFPAIGMAASEWIITLDGIVAILFFSAFSVAIGIGLTRSRGTIFPLLFYFLSFVGFLIFIY
ncbi:MAG: sodium:calcium antiporter [Thermoplasmata archaeon]